MNRALVAGLGAPLLVVLPGAAADALVTCQGEEATIVGVGTRPVSGTEGDDVIVAAGVISAGAGDDTICTGGSRVYAGAGDDSVTTYGGPVVERFVELGDGDDRYVGDAGRDVVGVFSAMPWMESYDDRGDDVVSTGAGDDVVRAGGSGPEPHADRVDTGPGDDQVDVVGLGISADGSIDGGTGTDGIQFAGRPGGVARLDVGRRSMVVNGRARAPRWTSIEAHTVRLEQTAVRVVGTGGADRVAVMDADRLDVALGAGDDVLRVVTGGRRGMPGRALGGSGRDRVELSAPNGVVDLARGYAASRRAPAKRLRLSSFVDVTTATGASVVGDHRANRLDVACGRVQAGRGDDVVRQTGDFHYDALAPAPTNATTCRRLVVRGGPGRDRIRGSLSPDVLVGGPGRDRVDGLAGRDRCVAEREVRCER